MLTSSEFDVLNSLQSKVTETIGKIELASIHSSKAFVVVSRLGGEGASLVNDAFNSGVENLSYYELAVPLYGIDLDATSMNPVSLLGKYVKITEQNGRALKAEYLGEHIGFLDSPSVIPREVFYTARLNLLDKNIEMTPENVQKELQTLGVSRKDAIEVFGIDLREVLNNVILWAGDSYYQKDTGKAAMKEVVVDPPDIVKYLNSKPIKMKACHKFNKLFTGR